MNAKRALPFVSLVSSIALLIAGASAGLAQGGAAAPTDSTAAREMYPVMLGERTLFSVRGNVEGYRGSAPENRAKGIAEKIKSFADDPAFPLDSLSISSYGKPMTLIAAGDKLLMIVLDSDTAATGRTREELARSYRNEIRTAIIEYRLARSRGHILRAILYAAIAVLALVLVLFLLNRLRRFVARLIDSWWERYVKRIEIQSNRIVKVDRMRLYLLGGVKTLWIVLILIAAYFCVNLVLGFFPWTRPFATRILGYLLAPLGTIGRGILDQLPNFAFIVVLAILVRYLLKIMKALFNEVEKGAITIPGFYPEWGKATYQILSFLVIALALVVAYPYIPGSDSLAFKGISVFIGVLFSLGSQSSIANTIAGFMLTYRRVFRVGDRVRIADFMGDVLETRLQVTVLRTPKNEEVVVPNSLILNSHVVNFSSEARSNGLILHTTVTIGYAAPWRKVHELLLRAAERTPGVLREPAPFVLQQSLGDFYVTYELNAYSDNPRDMIAVYSALHQNIQDSFNEGGVEIMSPHYTQLRDGNETTIPESYLPRDYEPGALRIRRTGRDDEA